MQLKLLREIQVLKWGGGRLPQEHLLLGTYRMNDISYAHYVAQHVCSW